MRSSYLLDGRSNYRLSGLVIVIVELRVYDITKNENCSKVKKMDMLDEFTERL